jgi:uncharacterized linocin/CFP29 family protein
MFGIDNSPAQITNLNAAGGGLKGAGGSCARRLAANNWDPNALRTNATLMYDEWKVFDRQVTQIARERLMVTQELMGRGLTYPIANALGVIQLVWQTSGDLNPAEVTMTGLPEADKDQLDFGLASMPIPMIHKEFTLDLRYLETTRRMGNPIDTTMAEVAMRKVAEMVEAIIFTGLTIATNLGNIYGLLTHPNRTTGSVTVGWGTATGAQILADALAMVNALTTKNMFGPYLIFLPTGVFNNLYNDFKANGDDTIIDRLLKLPNIQGIMPTNRLTGNQVLMVQLTSDVIQIIDGIQPTMVEWEERGGFEINFMVFCILLPRVRADYAGQSGIAHWS